MRPRIIALSSVAVVFAAACDDRKTDPPVVAGRVNAAHVTPQQGATTEAFCDGYFTAEKAPPYAWPALADGGTPPPSGTSWRWINLWATWCKPCIEEMPRLVRWRDKLAAAGHKVELTFISVDESAADVEAFRKQHPELPASLRIPDPDQLQPWFTSVGLDGAPPIPIHVYVDGSGRTRCARAGSVREQDYAIVEKLLGP
ncbi:MAG: TlpA family protein disulfide reductase [Kofleriaceae bacterium]